MHVYLNLKQLTERARAQWTFFHSSASNRNAILHTWEPTCKTAFEGEGLHPRSRGLSVSADIYRGDEENVPWTCQRCLTNVIRRSWRQLVAAFENRCALLKSEVMYHCLCGHETCHVVSACLGDDCLKLLPYEDISHLFAIAAFYLYCCVGSVIIIIIISSSSSSSSSGGAWGSVVVQALRYYSEGLGIDPQ